MRCNGCTGGFCTNRCDMDIRPCHLTDKIQLSSCGLVWRVKKGGLYRLKPYDNKGILYIDLYEDGGQKRLGELMLRAFDVKGEGRVLYRDENPHNCKLENLSWSK